MLVELMGWAGLGILPYGAFLERRSQVLSIKSYR